MLFSDKHTKASFHENQHMIVGHVMPDGTIYAGVSIETKTPMFARPQDDCIEAQHLAARLYIEHNVEKNGHKGSQQITLSDLQDNTKDDGGWRLPSINELKQLYGNKEEIGNFSIVDREISLPSAGIFNSVVACSAYWALATENGEPSPCNLSFSNGYQSRCDKNFDLSVRYVRTEPRI